MASDLRFKRPKDRWANRQELSAAITNETRKWDRDALLEELYKLRGSISFPVGPVNTLGDLHTDPQLKQRGMLRPTKDGRFFLTGNPIKILGEDVDQVSGPA